MVSSQPTRKVLKELGDAGFSAGRTVGSHTQWKHPSGASVSVPDGHKQISPGVYRKVLKAIKDSKDGTK
jgi:predicted RNA binding protein YcfA (HicA-like mRNA interferase family)